MFAPVTPLLDVCGPPVVVRSKSTCGENQSVMPDFFPVLKNQVSKAYHWETFHAMVPGVSRLVRSNRKPLVQTLIFQFFNVL